MAEITIGIKISEATGKLALEVFGTQAGVKAAAVAGLKAKIEEALRDREAAAHEVPEVTGFS